MIQLCVAIFVLNLSTLCLMVIFSPNDLKKNDDIILKYFGL